MLKRAIFGAVYVAVIIAGILGGPYALLLLLLLLSTLAVNEFLMMVAPPVESRKEAAVGLLLRSLDCLGAAVMVVTFWNPNMIFGGFMLYLLYVVARLSVQLWLHDRDAIRSLGESFMAQLYIALPISLMNYVCFFTPHLLLLLFILVWVNDTFAYLVGSKFGRHRLWERISPKKSWEGFWGGLVATVICAALCGYFANGWFGGFAEWKMALIGLIVAVSGTIGDLVESMIKRTVGVKDSSHLIPGHGGILDRIDSILMVIPSVIIVVSLIEYVF